MRTRIHFSSDPNLHEMNQTNSSSSSSSTSMMMTTTNTSNNNVVTSLVGGSGNNNNNNSSGTIKGDEKTTNVIFHPPASPATNLLISQLAHEQQDSNNMNEAPESPTTEIEHKVRHAADQSCWNTFVSISFLIISLFIVLIWSQWSASGGATVQANSLEYFVLCMIGGFISGLPHVILTPLDQIKCRMQTGEFSSVLEGFNHIWYENNGTKPYLARISALFRGYAPTFWGYSCQNMTKFSLYEYFKWAFQSWMGSEIVRHHPTVLFLAASGCAEFFADILLAPGEAVKVKVQTNMALPSKMSLIVPRMYRIEGFYAFYKGLPALWSRQIVYTMVKFVLFENFTMFFYNTVLQAPKSEISAGGQLFIALICGFLAGCGCSLASHVPDTLVSKLNQKSDSRIGTMQIIQELGCAGLWKGVLARMIFIGVMTMLQFTFYSAFKTMVGLTNVSSSSAGSSSSSSSHHNQHLHGHNVNAPPSLHHLSGRHHRHSSG